MGLLGVSTLTSDILVRKPYTTTIKIHYLIIHWKMYFMASAISVNFNNISQFINSELWENFHFSSHEYVHIDYHVNTLNTAPFEGSIQYMCFLWWNTGGLDTTERVWLNTLGWILKETNASSDEKGKAV